MNQSSNLKSFLFSSFKKMTPLFVKALIKKTLFSRDLSKVQERKFIPRAEKAGINIIGPVEENTGLGEACRSEIRALKAAKIPHNIINCPLNLGYVKTPLFGKELPYDVNLFHMNPDSIPSIFRRVPLNVWRHSYNIGFWAWELEELPEFWKKACNLFDEIWVPSHFTAGAVRKSTDKPVRVLPHSIAIVENVKRDRASFNLPENSFLFFAMYDTDSFSTRKNPTAIIDAYERAFGQNSTETCLVLKVKKGLAKVDKNLKRLLDERKDIIVIDTLLSREELTTLYASIDCYVSLHRSEGFGLSLAEAMALGKPCIATNWSGNVDFMDNENSLLVDYSMVKVGRNFLPGTSRLHWADADLNHASALMKKIADDKGLYSKLSQRAQDSVRENLGPVNVGRIMEEFLSKRSLSNNP